MRKLRGEIDRVARSDATVLVLGESGTGKELVARTLHRASERRDEPFVAVNCGAIVPALIEAELFGHERGSFTGAHQRHAGYFERAAGGTLFLDEISEMTPAMQVRVLRVIESRQFSRVGGSDTLTSEARVVAATSRDLLADVAAGRFRHDLLYRLAVVPLRVPPLRERGDDIALLARHFVDSLNARTNADKRLSRRSIDALRTHRCPGNVRELQNLVQRAFILADDELDIGALLDERRPLAPERGAERVRIAVGTPLDVAEGALIDAALDHFTNDKVRTAAALGISLKTLYNRLNARAEAATRADGHGRRAPSNGTKR